jgi:hypothetical protein
MTVELPVGSITPVEGEVIVILETTGTGFMTGIGDGVVGVITVVVTGVTTLHVFCSMAARVIGPT